MNVLVLNAGSSSLKAEVIGDEGSSLALTIERIGEDDGNYRDHAGAVAGVLAALERAGTEIGAVGHRVVHGGEAFVAPTLVDDAVLEGIAAHVPLAPLHNPANLDCLLAAIEVFDSIPHVAVFDTAFHATMPPEAYRYAVPEAWYSAFGVRRYGFHGTSHAYVSRRAAVMLERPLEDLAIVTAHLGNGASVCAVDGGRSVDTSMGLGPLAGLVMGTRSGDVDPTVVFHMVDQHGFTLDAVEERLNRASGLRGLAGSNDMRDVEAAADRGEPGAVLALDVLAHRLAGYVGAYAVGMGRLDALVFTAGIGEHSPRVRAAVCDRLGLLGVTLDVAANDAVDGEARIDAGSGPAVVVVPTDEEGEIARQVRTVLAG